MSYLLLPGGIPDFSKAVISLWFRVPSASVIAAATSSLPTTDPAFSIMQGILPLVTFGRQQQSNNYIAITDPDIVAGGPPLPPFPQQVGWSLASTSDVNPCYIGLGCDTDGTFRVEFNLQGANKGSYSSLVWFLTRLSFLGELPPDTPVGSGIVGNYQSTIDDGTYALQDAQAEYFNVRNSVWLDSDTWHHLLLSFDVAGACSIGPKPVTDCKLWYAIDDINYSGVENMGPFRDSDDQLGQNDIITRNTWHQSGWTAGEFPRLFYNNWIPAPFGGCTPGPIPSNGGAFALPASESHVDGIFRVEMAEFQLFTDVTLDTGQLTDRRAFVDRDGKPAPPSAAEELLGRRPDLLLHGTSNWQAGKNTGSLGVERVTDGDDVVIPSGQFQRTGVIDPYKPEPSLDEGDTDSPVSRSIPPIQSTRNRNARL